MKYKKQITAFLILTFTFTGIAFSQSLSIPSHPSKLKFDSLNWSVPMGDPYRTVLKNGLRAYIASDSTLPLVEISGYVRCGSLFDPSGKEGLGRLLGTLLRSGGTDKIPADTLDKIIDLDAMNFSFSFGNDQCSFKASFLSEFTDTAFTLLKQMLFSPAFEQKKIDQQKAIYIEAIKHRFDNPGPTLAFAYDKAMYPNTLNSRSSSEKTVASITRDDLVKMHKKYFLSGNMIIAISGSFNRDSIINKLENIFPKSTTVTDTVFPSFDCKPGLKSLIVNKQISQAYVRIGIPLFKRPNDDYYPVLILNEIFGGGSFTSRLSSRVRSDEGLTYSIYSSCESNYTFPATWYITFFTKSESFSKASGIVFDEIDSIVKNGVTDKELNDVKSVFISELPSMFRSPYDIVSTYAYNEYYGRPSDQYKKYPDEIRKVTKNDLLKIAKKYLVKENFTFTVVGDTSAILKQKDSLFNINNTVPQKVLDAAALPLLH
jgi:zinc protease